MSPIGAYILFGENCPCIYYYYKSNRIAITILLSISCFYAYYLSLVSELDCHMLLNEIHVILQYTMGDHYSVQL